MAAVEIAVGLVDDQRKAVGAGKVAEGRQVSAGYSTPPGLFGLTSTMARVRGVISASAALAQGSGGPRYPAARP
jgi:hypothetical protein